MFKSGHCHSDLASVLAPDQTKLRKFVLLNDLSPLQITIKLPGHVPVKFTGVEIFGGKFFKKLDVSLPFL